MNRKLLLLTFAALACVLCSMSAWAAEAYVNYTPSNTTLTFYYDNLRSTREGRTYDLNGDDNYPAWYQDYTRNDVTRAVFDPSFANYRPTSTSSWFHGMTNLLSITGMAEYLNTSQVTTMRYMFSSCSGLTDLDVSHFNTSNVTLINHMFYGCSNLTSLDVSGFNTSKVTYMNAMFYGCSGLRKLNLSSFNTANVETMNGMFQGCSGLTRLGLSTFNTAKVTNMNNMFQNCSNLETICVSDGWSTARVNYSTDMFTGCNSIVGGQGTTYDANHVNKAYAHIDGGSSNPGYLTEKGNEAYAVFTSDDLTLTFYYDDMRDVRDGEGDAYGMNTGTDNPGWGDNIVVFYFADQVVFDPSFSDARPVSTYGWFWYMVSLRSITGIEYLNTTEVTNMGHMFDNCALSNIDLSHFNTANVTDMSYMFKDCNLLTSLDLSHFNTANVTDMSYMFYNCTGLTSLNMSNFNTAKVTDMKGMFTYCGDLTSLDVSHFNTARVTDMSRMFGVCSSLTSLDLSSFNTANVTNMYHMFAQSDNLRTIYVGNSWNTNAVTNSISMFDGCTSLVGGKGTTYDANHVDKAYAHIDGGTSNPGYLTEKSLETYACYTPSNTTLTFYYDSNRASRSGTTYDLNTGSNKPVWYTDSTCRSVTKVVFNPSFADVRPTSTYFWFREMENLTTIERIEYLNTSEVTNMSSMFSNCSSLTSLDVSHFNTSNVTSLPSMFNNCRQLTTLDVSNFNTSNVKSLYGVFYNCSSLTSLDVSNFNTSNVTSMYGLFYNCSGLTSLDVSHFNTSNVTSMYGMFFNCSGLTSLDVTNFNTAKVTNMAAMFYNCRGLTSLDLSSFTTSKVTNMNQMLGVCDNLTTIYVGEGWSTAAVTTSNRMFISCTKLVGGQGTTYDANHIDAAYARIDGGPNNPGYFTDPNADPEAYACYTPSNMTLTFYCDNQRSTRAGTTYDLNTDYYAPGWCSDHSSSSVTQVVFDPSFADARPTTTASWFDNMQNLQSITGIAYLNTEEVTIMQSMFFLCESLTSLDLSGFNTTQVTNMCSMFQGCTGLTSLDLSHFNTANVTDMTFMFFGCNNLVTIYAGDDWSTAAVTESNNMFHQCWKLVGGQGTTYDANHTNMAYARIDGGPSNPGYFTAKFLLGDVNGDGVENVTDATVLINALLNENFSGINYDAADINGDGLVNITDATQLINRLLNSRKM